MEEFVVKLNQINQINQFISFANRCNYPIVVKQGRYAVNGRSIMGLFSLNLEDYVTIEGYKEDSIILEQIKLLGEIN